MASKEELQEIQLFLALLFPWDDEGEQLYKSVSWTFTSNEGKTGVANYATQPMDKLLQLITSRIGRPGANVYVCLGTQRMASTDKFSSDGYPRAIRQQKNMVSLRCIALDIDVGKAGAYATTEEAFAALDAFCADTGMPKPTMEVNSGSGGLHVYWCFTRSVTVDNWLPLAKGLQAAALNWGLKFDPQVTVNSVGILRVPNSYHHKKTPPGKVFLYRDPGHDFPRYSPEQLTGVLARHVKSAMPGAIPPGNKINSQRAANFGAGISDGAKPVPIEELAINCPAIADILDREGDGDAEPLWNLALLAASFTTDPAAAAHVLSQGDRRYAYADTEKKLLEKINARASNPNVGWPTCDAFSQLHPACASCPLLAAHKTPFHHVPAPVPASAGQAANFIPSGSDPLPLPDGYWRNQQGHIYTLVANKDGDQYAACIINYPILDAGLDIDSGALLYQAVIGGVPTWREINVGANMMPQQAASALAHGYGVFINPKNFTAARDFLVTWVSHLQNLQKHKRQSAYGWQGTAFAYDDKVFYPDRTENVYRGRHHDKNFRSNGELKPWQDAMPLVYGNMPLETIVASSFAAPLVELIGSTSLVLSIFSSLSGVGKTTAMTLGQAVWGHPRTGMSTLADTTNSTMKKIADLKSLPIYWDELTTRGAAEKVVEVVFQTTQGKAKARLNRDSTQQEADEFTTLFIVASNYGIADMIYANTEATEAGGLRVFEIEAQPLVTSFRDSDARQMMLPLKDNYGNAGAIYAEWLALNRDVVKAMLKRLDASLGNELDLKPKERFWGMTMTTLLVGAQIANSIGLTSFDIPRLRDYIAGQMQAQRGEMKAQEFATLQTTADAAGLLGDMFSELHNRHMIITDRIPYTTRGRPTPVNFAHNNVPDLSRMGGVWVQLGDKDGRVRLKVRKFNDWLRDKHLNPKQVIDMLKGRYVVTKSKQTIGSGVPGLDALSSFGRSECYDLTPLPQSSASSPSPGSGAPN
jgi:hypothetical protein